MTQDAQRIAIAEACGWTEFASVKLGEETILYGLDPHDGGYPEVPDYLNDLNAMHEAEEIFIGEGKAPNYFNYRQQLYKVCAISPELSIRATACQRAEALLRTINKLDDSK